MQAAAMLLARGRDEAQREEGERRRREREERRGAERGRREEAEGERGETRRRERSTRPLVRAALAREYERSVALAWSA